jgi:hypothetical protein
MGVSPSIIKKTVAQVIPPEPCPTYNDPEQANMTRYQLTDVIYYVNTIECSQYSIDTTCPIDNAESCEVCKNFAYQDWYNENNASNISFLANFSDTKLEYNRTWIQTCNLGIGIVLLSIGIYYQQSD